MAAEARLTVHGPARHSAARRVADAAASGHHVVPHLPTHPFNRRRALTRDAAWYAAAYERVRERFDRWLARLGAAPATTPARKR